MSKGIAETANGPEYVLGHSDRELARLKAQATLIDPTTRRFLRAAGITPGMCVLDVGSGAGDVAFLAAELVGDSGSVIGVDRAPAAVTVASARAAARALTNVMFREGDPADMSFDRPFDAVIGRYVLQFQKDPAAVLRRLATHARPGGTIVFHEIDWSGLASIPPVPTFDLCCQWGADAMRLHGTETHMGTKLHSAFVDAGLGLPRCGSKLPWGACLSLCLGLKYSKSSLQLSCPRWSGWASPRPRRLASRRLSSESAARQSVPQVSSSVTLRSAPGSVDRSPVRSERHMTPNPSFHRTCYGLRPSHAGELKR